MTPPEHPIPPLTRKLQRLASPAGRLWLYGIGVATLPILVAYGLLTPEQAPLWAALLLAALAIAPPAVAAGALGKQLATGQLEAEADER